MDRLPPEILAVIVSYLNPFDLIKYVSISRQWQFAIERYTFRSLRLKSDDYDFFTRVCSDSHRAAAVAELEYDVILPAYSDEQCAKFESDKDEKANNEALTNAIKRLFETLRLWGTSSNDGAHKKRGRPIMLSLGAYSTTDPRYREAKARPRDLWEQRYENSFLTVLNPDELPSIERIVGFRCFRGSRKIDAATAAAIASKFPALGSVYWNLEDAAFTRNTPRYQNRCDFAQALSSIKPSNLKTFRLHYPFTEPRNEDLVIPSAVPPTSFPDNDPLSSALYNLSLLPNLETFQLSGPIAVSPTLFGPSVSVNKNNTSNTSPSMYPKLQAFTLELSRITPSGDLLFAGHPDNADSDSDSASDSDGRGDDTYGDDVADTVTNDVPHEPEPDTTSLTSHSPGRSANALGHNTSSAYDRAIAIGAHPVRLFRKRIVPELFNPFVAAFSRALYRMPALGHGHLLMGCSGEGLSAGVEVLAVGAGANGIWDHPAEEAARNRMRVTMGWRNGWVVPAEVRELWDQWVGEGGTLRINE